MIDRAKCAGCRDDFYNTSELAVGGMCWSRKTGKIVKRLKVHMDQVPPWKNPVRDYPDCYRAKGHVMVKPEDRR